jgi:hypothetical protein
VSLLRDFDDLEVVDKLVTVVDKSRKRSRPDSGFENVDSANLVAYRA